MAFERAFLAYATLFLLSFSATGANASIDTGVKYDARSFSVNGERKLILSGGIHYNRVPREDWAGVFQNALDMGLNHIQTYVFWSFHEQQRGEITWEGQADFPAFVQLAGSMGLTVTVRIGPYICGEYTFGGIPFWMREASPKCFRCSDAAWENEMQRWVSIVVDKIKPLFASNGGPILMLQIENEFHGDQQYLDWSVDMARNLTTDIPWNLCHDRAQCATTNNGKNTVLCTINGFWLEDYTKDPGQPSPIWIKLQREANPNQPFVWTEDQGWFDEWGVAQRQRSPTDQIYGIARGIAYGLSYHNFYMLTGGNNYGRHAGGNVITAYAPDTVIDFLLLRHAPRFEFYGNFFRMLQEYSTDLLSNPVASAQQFSGNSTGMEYMVYGKLGILSNYGGADKASVTFMDKTFVLTKHSVVFVDTSSMKVVFDTSVISAAAEAPVKHKPALTSTTTEWEYFTDTVGVGHTAVTSATGPTDQLALTDNDSDYAWYNTTVSAADLSSGTVTIKTAMESIPYAYVNGERLSTLSVSGSAHVFSPPKLTTSGVASLAILSCAMGVKNNPVGPSYTKGVVSVSVGGVDVTKQPWTMSWNNTGEVQEIMTAAGTSSVPWAPVTPSIASKATNTWFRAYLDLPHEAPVPVVGGGQPNQTAYVLNLASMAKGTAYVNGFNLGRYWLTPGKCSGACAFAKGPVCFMTFRTGSCGAPTQHLYHIPAQVLKPTNNLVVLYEEDGSLPSSSRVPSNVSLSAITAHPALD